MKRGCYERRYELHNFCLGFGDGNSVLLIAVVWLPYFRDNPRGDLIFRGIITIPIMFAFIALAVCQGE